MSILFILLFSSLVHVSLDEKAKLSQYSIERTEKFFDLFPLYYNTALDISGTKTLNYLVSKAPLDNFTESFEHCLLTGKMNDYTMENCSLNPEDDSTLESILSEISNMASAIYRGNCTINVLEINVEQESAYKLSVTSKVKILFQKHDFIVWDMIFDLNKKLSIVGITNPMIKDYANIPIQYGVDELFTKQEFNGNISRIKDYVINGYTFVDSNSSSFIDAIEGRILEGTYEPSPLGLNLFIPNKFPDGTYSYVENRSMFALDYIQDKYYDKTDLRLINDLTLKKTNLTFYVYDLILMNLTSPSMLYATDDCHCDNKGCYC